MNTPLVLFLAALAVALPAQADPVNWVQWDPTFVSGATNGSATGTALGVAFTYTGEVEGLSFGYPSWTPTTTFDAGAGTPPLPSQGMIALFGGGPGVNTITFSTAVWNLHFAIWSLGSTTAPATFDFGSGPVIVESGGPSAEYGGTPILGSGTIAGGIESNGVVVLPGSHWSITWTNPNFEDYYGFTVGITGITACPGPPPDSRVAALGCRPPLPEPQTVALFGSGLAGFAILVRRRRRLASRLSSLAS